MRPGQNKRMRGRNNNNGSSNRKGPNPLTRSYESNGPDVKIRGTAHHIGEKYLQLARDAQSSGDPVMAESYLQHAEHYFRLIAAAQQAAYGYQRSSAEIAEAEEEEGDDEFSSLPDRFASFAERPAPQPQPQPPQAQPYIDRPVFTPGDRPASDNRQDRSERYERQGQPDRGEGQRERYDNRQDRGNRGERQPYGERGFDRGQDRGQQERNASDRSGPPRDYDNRGPRNNRGGRDFRGEPSQPREMRDQRQQEADGPVTALPAFITAPLRIQPDQGPADEPIAASVNEAPQAPETAGGEDASFALRPRRRRRTKADFAGSEAAVAHEAPSTDTVAD